VKTVVFRRVVVARMACPVCYEPARLLPPRRWLAVYGPRPSWSHVDGEPLCPVVGADGYRPARRGCVMTTLRLVRDRDRHRRSCAMPSRPTVAGRAVWRAVGAP
jgi:hypothetical protein